ncbi:hypothetical protein ACFL1E_00875 [Candidatus Omnitrophota bacterium]
MLPQQAYASGYHPPFDQAVKEAELIVLGDVIEAWDPKAKQDSERFDFSEGRAYRMRVEKVYKGDVKAGDEIIFWDAHYMSTASYHVSEGNKNLTFLVPAELSEFEKRHFQFGTPELYRPITNCNQEYDFDIGEYQGYLYLLDLTLMNPPEDLRPTYTKILREENNRYVLRYVFEHWPAELTQEDILLFRETFNKHYQDAYVTNPAIERLALQGEFFDDTNLRQLLKEGSSYQRMELLAMVDAKNIKSVEDILFDWIMEEERNLGEQESIEILADLSPEYLRKQLSNRKIPFWKLIPCLQALEINGSDVGKEDFSPEILALDPYTISNIGEVYSGKDFHGICAMDYIQELESDFDVIWGYSREREKWKTALPLFEPLLKKPDSPIRRLVVALMRTYGLTVVREGDGYVVDRSKTSASPPVRLEIEAPKEPFQLGDSLKQLRVKETAIADGAWFSFNGSLSWAVREDDGGTAGGGGTFGIFENVDIPKDKFVQLEEGQTFYSSDSLGWSMSRPGRYYASVSKVYPHDGASVGLDAWTGTVFSNTVEIEVVE